MGDIFSKRLTFDEDYFKDEYREGFLVPSQMKSAWAAQLEVLVEVIRICNKHNIEYYADWGTLLGVVRHKGFIPWDDDIDIAMKRKDYNRFLTVVIEELPKGWKLLHSSGDIKYDNGIARIVNATSIDTSEERLNNFHKCPFVIGVDIFPLDYFPKNLEYEDIQKNILTIVTGIIIFIKDGSYNYDEVEEKIKQVEQLCNIFINRNGLIINQLYNLCDRLSSIYTSDESENLTCFCGTTPAYIGEKIKLKKEWYDETIQMPFENIMITVPKRYNEILTVLYGDYMVPIKTEDFEEMHDYPFYKEQEKVLNEYIKNNQLINVNVEHSE